MLTYQIDRTEQSKASNRIKDMMAVLEEIPQTLEILSKQVSEHAAAISTPAINPYQDDLLRMSQVAAELTHNIAAKAQRLTVISDQAAKHLAAIDEHFGAALRDNNVEVKTPAVKKEAVRA